MKYLLNKDEMASCFSEDLCGVVSNAGVGFWVWNVKENIVEYNDNFTKVLGYTRETMGELSWERLQTFVYSEDVERVQYHYEHTMSTEEGYHEVQYRLLNSRGGIVWVREYCAVTKADMEGNPEFISAMVGDITGLRKNLARMEAQSMHANDIMQTLGIAEWELDIPSNIVTYSPSFEQLVGWSAEELNGSIELQHSIIYPGDLDIYREALQDYLKNPIGTFHHRQRLLHKNGTYINVFFVASVTQKDDIGNPLKITGGSINVEHTLFNEGLLSTKLEKTVHANQKLQKQIEENAKNTRIMNNAMFETNPNVSVMFNDKYEIINCNPKAIKFFNYNSKKELLVNLAADLSNMINPYQPNGKKSIPLKARLDIVAQEGYHEFDTVFSMNEELVPLNIIMQKVPYDKTHVFIVNLIEVKAIQQAKLELAKKKRLLRGVNDVARVLLEHDYADYNQVLTHALGSLGECVDAYSVFLWRNYETKEDGYFAKNLTAWGRDWEADTIEKKIIYDSDIPKWNEQRKGREELLPLFIKSNEITEEFKRKNTPQGLSEIILIPITIEGNFWGFISFSYEETSLLYSLKESDMAILRSGAMMIASAINKNEINASLVEAKEKALESMKSKSEFLSRMSHEIRTPMNAIMGMAMLSTKSNNLADIKQNMKIVEFSSKQLLQIINDVLDMSKIDANKMELENNEFYIRELLDHVASVMRVGIDEKKQTLYIEMDDKFDRPIYSDRLRISQVLINLLSNANKFTPEGGEIKIIVEEASASENEVQVEFSVVDNGIGISEEALPVIFDSFEQGDGSITRKYGGTGLGLTISKRIVDLLGGELEAHNCKPHGAVFSFTLNVAWGKAESGLRLSEEASKTDTRIKEKQYDFFGKRILLVEDNEINRMLVVEILSETGVLIDEVENGEECVKHLTKNPNTYDLIIMDIQMPVMDGLQATRMIRQMEAGWAKSIPILALTANAFKEDREACYEAGMNDYIAKPLELNDLMEKIEEYLFIKK